MFKRILLSLVSGVAMVSAGSMAHAGVILFDNFDFQIPDQLNWPGDTVFTSIPPPGNVPGSPSVDLIGVGGAFDFYPGHGSYVDLDGSTGIGISPAGQLELSGYVRRR